MKKYLNLLYGGMLMEIDVGAIERMGVLKDLIKAKYEKTCGDVDAYLIQLYKPHSEEQITDLDDIPQEYYKEGGLALEIRTLTPPRPATQPIQNVQQSPAAISNLIPRAECLKDDPATKEMVQVIEDVIATNKKEYIFYALSSGMGKTQMAHTLMKCYEGKRKVIYMLGQRFNGNTRSVYHYYTNITELFHRCMHADLQNLKDDQLDSDYLSSKQLYVFGFIMKLFDEGNLQGICHIVPELARKVIQRLANNNHEKPIIIIDEYRTAGDQSSVELQFIRNCFIAAGLNPLLMGTNIAAVDTFEAGGHSNFSRVVAIKWARIFAKPTKVTEQSCGLDKLNYQLDGEFGLITKMILNSRPLFAVDAVEYLQKHEPAGDFLPYLDNMLDSLHDKFLWWKNIGSKPETQRGQLMLTLNSSYALADLEEEGNLVHRHYANLHSETDLVDLIFDYGMLYYKDLDGMKKPWVPIVLFPTPQEDMLLHLTMMVQPNVKRRTKEMKYERIQQRSNYGKFLEACMVSTIVHASHMNGVTGIAFHDFLPHLAYEFYTEEDATAGPGQLIGKPLTVFNERKIPFLLAPNQELNSDFSREFEEAGALLATCQRTINADRIDFAAMNMDLTVEAKDCSGNTDPAVMKAILERVPKDSSIHILMTRGFQKSYFTQNDFKKEVLNLDNLEPMPAFFVMEPVVDSESMVVNAELSWINGLPHDGTATRIVLFVVVPER
ncbi:hypothetical protein MP638_003407 [Amoeboaphelidium occidentale]|nr:hypothetical protein MP638_003407 [Amoeboaphelidium occidentale]